MENAIRLAPILSDGAVFQRGEEIRVFGTGTGDVSVTFRGRTRSTAANGAFLLTFPPEEAGGPYEMTVTAGKESRTLRDLMVGDVWMLAGQSNAELPISQTADRDVRFTDSDAVRIFTVRNFYRNENYVAFRSQRRQDDVWRSLRGDSAGDWPALALHIGRRLSRERGVTVGVVFCAQGASSLRSYLKEETYAAFGLDDSLLCPDNAVYPWNGAGFLRKEMLLTVAPYRVGALVWYQGESDRTTYEGERYAAMLEAFVGEWREAFRQSVPTVIVQINDYPAVCADGVRAIQGAQEKAAVVIPDAALVKIADLGDHARIHPENKKQVADRIAETLAVIWANER